MMTKPADIIFKDKQFFISGEIDFDNVMSLYKKSLLDLDRCSALVFDFSQLKLSNSTGLALIIAWLQYAKSHQKEIRFIHLPAKLIAIAELAGVRELIE